MSKIFRFNVTETNWGFIDVEAETQEEAEEKVYKCYDYGEAQFHDTDVDFEIDLDFDEEIDIV
jgi:hypothetical protein